MNRHKLTAFLLNKVTLTTLSAVTIILPLLSDLPSTIAKPTPQVAQAKPENPTLKNLQEAYNGESNANVMYLAYAKKADQEGYKEVGSLFRAAAKAEAIHRDNHAKVIKEMGATPKNTITNPVVKSTAENLEQAIKGETYESETMYPDFIKQAKEAKKQNAIQTLTYAQEAEAGHVKLYTEAKNNLKNWKQAKQFYVCSVSGYTTMTANDNKCLLNNVKKPVESIK